MYGKSAIIGGLLLATGIAGAQVINMTIRPAIQPAPEPRVLEGNRPDGSFFSRRAIQHAPAPREGVPGGGCQVFFTKTSFEAFNQSDGKFMKGIETFEESDVADGVKLAIPAPLQGGVPSPGFPNGLTEFNLTIQDNITPGPSPALLNPSGDPQALYVIGTGFIGANSKKVGEDLEVLFGQEASYDLIFDGNNKTGVGFTLSHFDQFPGGDWVVAVYDINNNLMGKFNVADAIEPAKTFFGVWCDTPIGRINVWDEEIGPDAIDNIQMWVDQVPTCQWDCAIPADKEVGINDFLALLAQWGLPGPCDFDGGGVGINDFLKLLANWGPCPTPINDECAGKIFIDRFDSNGTHTQHFDMYGATPSPDPSQCLPAGVLAKDIWYCLTNATNEKKIVTLSGTVNLLAEVTSGCDCANPGQLVACGPLVGPIPTFFTMQPGEQVCIRLHNDLNLPNDQIKGDLVITNQAVPPDDLNVFLDEGQFNQHLEDKGKVSKLDWDFKPHALPPDDFTLLDSPLDINTHGLDPNDPWTDAGGTDLWPPSVDNIQFAASLNPGGPFVPGGIGDLAFLSNGFNGLNNNALSTCCPGRSLVIISGPPAGDNHTAFGLELVDVLPDGVAAQYRITVYDKQDQILGQINMTVDDLQKVFLGVQAKDTTIGWIEIAEIQDLAAAISRVTAWQFDIPGTVRFDEDPASFINNLPPDKVSKFSWNFKPDYLPPNISIGITSPLDINTHPVNAPGVWFDPVADLWPPSVDNVQFATNLNPAGPFVPGQQLGYVKGGPGGVLDNNALVALDPGSSLTIFSGPPAGDNHTAFELELVGTAPFPASFVVTVYDKQEVVMGTYTVTLPEFTKQYLGIVAPVTIGRIDIWDSNGGEEGISAITAWQAVGGQPRVVLAGDDCWSTPCGAGSQVNLVLPPDFFGPGCGPINQFVEMGGQTGFGDTVVRRLNDMVFDDANLPDVATTPIEIIQLDLVSCAPITVNCAGGPQLWQVEVHIETPQAQGQMDATKLTPDSGTYDATFPVDPRFTFVRLDVPGLIPSVDLGGFVMSTVGASFLQGVPIPGPLCDPNFAPGYGLDAGNPCCEVTCHDNPGGDHLHCAVPPKCQLPPCP